MNETVLFLFAYMSKSIKLEDFCSEKDERRCTWQVFRYWYTVRTVCTAKAQIYLDDKKIELAAIICATQQGDGKLLLFSLFLCYSNRLKRTSLELSKLHVIRNLSRVSLADGCGL